ncbi:hypothetical protein F7725_017767 [Dissostichus mawsoni]|uniref:Methyltransferase domain-containing protein n=1 Tax=Dissostichus mawsoni TaxID=36200 RepID=A0A7J5XPV2_DISMA|nr:hypothetical protein F7725_017767 [Dissostichus mawsoni]
MKPRRIFLSLPAILRFSGTLSDWSDRRAVVKYVSVKRIGSLSDFLLSPSFRELSSHPISEHIDSAACFPPPPFIMSDCSRTLDDVKTLLRAFNDTDPQQTKKLYDSWAETYDQDLDLLNYRAPHLAVDFLDDNFPGAREEVQVLDVACGSGLVAKLVSPKRSPNWRVGIHHHSETQGIETKLWRTSLVIRCHKERFIRHYCDRKSGQCQRAGGSTLPQADRSLEPMVELGFRHFVGVDCSKGMLDQAAKTGRYQDLRLALLGSDPLPAQTGVFDVVIMVGGLDAGFAPVRGFVCMARGDHRGSPSEDYGKDLQRELQLMEDEGCGVQQDTNDPYLSGESIQDLLTEERFLSGTVYLYQKSIQ